MMRRKLAMVALGLGCCGGSAAAAEDILVDPAAGPSLQSVIDRLPAEKAGRTRIFLKPGTYRQQLTVGRPRVAMIGLGAKPEEVVITYNLSAVSPKPDGSGAVGTTGSASTFVLAPDFLASNVTFANSTPDDVAQAVAIKTQADRCVFVGCRFIGFQDTLYLTNGRCYLRDCYITGDTDFIFGNATAVFDRCRVNSSGPQYITAANTAPESEHGFVFLDCTLTCDESVKSGSTYLGRPWQWDREKSAAVTWIDTRMGRHIAAAGWHPWSVEKNTDPGAHARYAEFGSVDMEGRPIDTSRRVAWSRQLTAAEASAYTVAKVLSGTDKWDPTSVINNVTNQGTGK